MKNLVFGLIYVIVMVFKFIGAILYVIWKFEINPILEEGVRCGYKYKPWDYKLWDWFWYDTKPEYRRIN